MYSFISNSSEETQLCSVPPECPQESLKQLICALEEVRRTLKNFKEFENNKSENDLELNSSYSAKYQQSLDCQEKSLLVQIVVTSLELKDFDLAITVMKSIFNTIKNDQPALKKALCSLLGRINLQLGDLQTGEKFIRDAHDSFQQDCSQHVQGLLDEGILAFAQGDFQKAYELFHKASLINPSDHVVRNNSAVCLLYLGRVKDAICTLEEAVNESAETNIQMYLKINFNTLTRLGSSRANLPMLREHNNVSNNGKSNTSDLDQK